MVVWMGGRAQQCAAGSSRHHGQQGMPPGLDSTGQAGVCVLCVCQAHTHAASSFCLLLVSLLTLPAVLLLLLHHHHQAPPARSC